MLEYVNQEDDLNALVLSDGVGGGFTAEAAEGEDGLAAARGAGSQVHDFDLVGVQTAGSSASGVASVPPTSRGVVVL